MRTPIRSQTNRKFYGPVSLLPENVVYRGPILRSRRKSLKSHTQTGSYDRPLSQPLRRRVHRLGPEELGEDVNVEGGEVLGGAAPPLDHAPHPGKLLED